MRNTVGIMALAILSTVLGASAQDVARASPVHHQILTENAYIRVVRARIPPGAREATYTHPAGWYYVTRPGTLRVTYADGRSETWHPHAGEQGWSDGEAPHRSENIGRSTLEYLLVEIKAAPTATPN